MAAAPPAKRLRMCDGSTAALKPPAASAAAAWCGLPVAVRASALCAELSAGRDGSHDWQHSERVSRLSATLALKEYGAAGCDADARADGACGAVDRSRR